MKSNLAAFVSSHVPPPGNRRTYVLSHFVTMIGNGVFMPIYVLYCTQIVGISYVQTGLASTLAGLIGIPLSLLAGDLADRVGPRRVVLFGLAGQLLGMASYVFIQGFWSLLIVVGSMNIFAFSYFASVGALMRRIGGADTVAFRSQTRTFANLAIALGALGAGVGIQIGTLGSYRVMFLAVAAAYLFSIITMLRIPNFEPLPRPESVAKEKNPRWIVLRDKAFVAFALVSGGMSLQNYVLDMLVPVWIVAFTSAPAWAVTAVYVINTVMVVLLQVRLGKDVQTARQGGSAMRRAGVALMLGYLVMATMAGQPAWLATGLVVAGIVLITFAEIWLVSGRFALEFTLPPEYAQGQYDGFSGMIATIANTSAPMLLIGFVLTLGSVGWIGLGVFFLLLGLISPAIAAWGERTRPQATAAPAEPPAEPEEKGIAA